MADPYAFIEDRHNNSRVSSAQGPCVLHSHIRTCDCSRRYGLVARVDEVPLVGQHRVIERKIASRLGHSRHISLYVHIGADPFEDRIILNRPYSRLGCHFSCNFLRTYRFVELKFVPLEQSIFLRHLDVLRHHFQSRNHLFHSSTFKERSHVRSFRHIHPHQQAAAEDLSIGVSRQFGAKIVGRPV